MAKQENHNDNHAATMTNKDSNIQVFNLNPTVPKFREKTSSFSKRIGSSAIECKELQQFNEATNAAAANAAAAGKDSPRLE